MEEREKTPSGWELPTKEEVANNIAVANGDLSSFPKPAFPTTPTAPASDTIDYAAFEKIKLKIGTIVGAHFHPDADKLLVLRVDLGDDTRTICAGLKERFKPENLVGKQVVVVVNLAPRKLRGVESHGMLLATSNGDGQFALIGPTEYATMPGPTEEEMRENFMRNARKPIKPGSEVK